MLISFISEEHVSYWAMFALGRDVYTSDDCVVVCYAVYYI